MGSLVAVGTRLEALACALEPVSSSQIITITPTEESVAVSQVKSEFAPIFERNTTWKERFRLSQKAFMQFISRASEPPKKDEASHNFFQAVFGEKRLKRLMLKMSFSEGDSITKWHVENLFVHASEVEMNDLEELLEEIHSEKSKVLFLNEEETTLLRERFQGVLSTKDCTTNQLEELFRLLIPFKESNHIFLNKPPTVVTPSLDSGKTFFGKRARVSIFEMMRRNKTSEELWTMYLAKKLIDREIPPNVVFRSARGNFCKVHKIIHGGGAFKTAILEIGKIEGIRDRKIGYRGTRPVFTATGALDTFKEDLRESIGSHGAQMTFDETEALLSDPAQGFVESPDDQVTGFGNSLGGAHLMHDGALFCSLVTVVSPGIALNTVQEYARKVNNNELGFVPTITHYVEDQDMVDQAGDARLGLGCDPAKAHVKICILRPLKQGEEAKDGGSLEEEVQKIAELRKVWPNNQELQNTLFDSVRGYAYESWHEGLKEKIKKLVLVKDCLDLIKEIFKTFTRIHNRNTLAKPHQKIVISNQTHRELVDTLLLHKTSPLVDLRYEKLRRSAGEFFSYTYSNRATLDG